LIPSTTEVTLLIFDTECRKSVSTPGEEVTMSEDILVDDAAIETSSAMPLDDDAWDTDDAWDDGADEALLENLLVEEVSIDGMCGVY
jgi:mycofactocin precursor